MGRAKGEKDLKREKLRDLNHPRGNEVKLVNDPEVQSEIAVVNV